MFSLLDLSVISGCSLVLMIICSPVCSIPLHNFYPFGRGTPDQSIFPNDDGASLHINLIVPFPFFDVNRNTAFVNTNGAVSFSNPVTSFTPEQFPLSGNQELITPYWADVDTRPRNGGTVWYRETANSSLLRRARSEITMGFIDQKDFNPVYMVIATWDHVGYYNMRTDKTNTFQCVLVMDGQQSFVIFLYADGEIQWTTGDASDGNNGLGGTPAQAGFNAGDGNHSATVPGSRTPAIINIDNTSNVDVPGMWIFQVDENIRSGGCSLDDSQTADSQLFISPRHGNMLGGQTVTVQGPCFDQHDNIVCSFDDVTVTGVFVSRFKVVCVSPQLSRAGRVPFRLTINGSPKGEATFSSLSVEQGHQVDILGDSIAVTIGSTLELRWDKASILPALNATDYTVDIQLYEYDITTQTWKERASLATNTENDGMEEVTISTTTIPVNRQVAPTAVFIFASNSPPNPPTAHPLHQRLINTRVKAGKWTAPLYYTSRQLVFRSRIYCEAWSLSEPEGVGERLLALVESVACPTTLTQARLPGSGLQQERYTSFYGNTRYNHQWYSYFHPNVSVCYKERVSLTSQVGQQCCYDNSGDLIVGHPGGGSVDRVSQESSRVEHFLQDVYPFVVCCKGRFPDCSKYYEDRPSDDGSNFVPPTPPGRMFGDPHIVTLDGFKYTFNGKGEFTLIETVDNSFTLQGRMVQATDAGGNRIAATVFSAIVGKQSDSDAVQFVLSRRGLDVLVNGVRIVDFTNIPFNGVTIVDQGNNTYGAVFSSGAYVEVREENGTLSSVIVAVPSSFRGKTRGLMGTYNGNTSDDLIPRFGASPLPPNPSIQEIHEHFGITWIINNSVNSLFTYQIYKNWNSFYVPNFTPIYEPTGADPELEELCEGDRFCLFDVAVTGRRDIGLSTLDSSRNVEQIIQQSLPVVCNPPCENGVCVANDTCKCAAGYEGERCNETAFIQVCDESPCGEGESCGLQAGSYVCVNCSTSEVNQDNRCSHLTLNPCIFGPCANGGRCELRSNNTFACTCQPGFCNNGGTCEKLSDNTFACICPPGYSGTTCEIPIFTVCYESPCGEGESCGVQAGSYVCVNCSTSEEHQDNRCSHLTLNPCIFGPCANGGRCELRSNNTFACTCPPGYSGTTCEASDTLLAIIIGVVVGVLLGLVVAILIIALVCICVRRTPKEGKEEELGLKDRSTSPEPIKKTKTTP